MGYHVQLLASPKMEDRFKAFAYFADNGSKVASALHDNLETREPDLLVNLLHLTAKTIPQESLGDLLTLSEQKGLDNPVRFSVYTALSHYPEFESTAPVLKAVTDRRSLSAWGLSGHLTATVQTILWLKSRKN